MGQVELKKGGSQREARGDVKRRPIAFKGVCDTLYLHSGGAGGSFDPSARVCAPRAGASSPPRSGSGSAGSGVCGVPPQRKLSDLLGLTFVAQISYDDSEDHSYRPAAISAGRSVTSSASLKRNSSSVTRPSGVRDESWLPPTQSEIPMLGCVD